MRKDNDILDPGPVLKVFCCIVLAFLFFELLGPMDIHRFHVPHSWLRALAVVAIGFGVYWLVLRKPDAPHRPGEERGRQIGKQVGTVISFITNHAGDVDGLELSIGGRTVDYGFPPHSASRIMSSVSEGDSVEISFHDGPEARPGHDRIARISNLSNGNEADIGSIPPPHLNLPGKEINISSSNFDLVYDRAGSIRGILIDGSFADLKPHEADKLQNLLKSAGEISINGVERDSGDGFVNLKYKHVVRVSKITIDGTTYLLR